jgi:hypothetical protein
MSNYSKISDISREIFQNFQKRKIWINTLVPLANLTLIILFSPMFEIFKNYSFQILWKKNSEHLKKYSMCWNESFKIN